MDIIILQSKKIAILKAKNSPDKVTEVKLTCHFHLVSRLRMNLSVHTAWTRTNWIYIPVLRFPGVPR